MGWISAWPYRMLLTRWDMRNARMESACEVDIRRAYPGVVLLVRVRTEKCLSPKWQAPASQTKRFHYAMPIALGWCEISNVASTSPLL